MQDLLLLLVYLYFLFLLLLIFHILIHNYFVLISGLIHFFLFGQNIYPRLFTAQS